MKAPGYSYETDNQKDMLQSMNIDQSQQLSHQLQLKKAMAIDVNSSGNYEMNSDMLRY